MRHLSRLAVLAITVACSQQSSQKPGGDNADEGRGDLALEALDAALGHAYCATLFAPEGDSPSLCCVQADIDLVFQNFDSKPANLAECEALVKKHASVAETIEKAVDTGRVTYDAERADACVALMERRPCDVLAAQIKNRVFDAPGYLGLSTVPLFCTLENIDVLTPTATAETGCTEDFQCTAGNFCNRPPLECKVVQDAPRQDAECDGTAPDRNGVCRRPNGQFAPKVCCEGVVVDCTGEAPPGKCEALPTEGKPCNGPCADGQTCSGFGENPTCTKKLADGEQCFFPGECVNTCVKTELNGIGTCGVDAPTCAGPSVDTCKQAEAEIKTAKGGECINVIEQDPPIDGCESFLPMVSACCGIHDDGFAFCF